MATNSWTDQSWPKKGSRHCPQPSVFIHWTSHVLAKGSCLESYFLRIELESFYSRGETVFFKILELCTMFSSFLHALVGFEAGFPAAYVSKTRVRNTALCDYVTRVLSDRLRGGGGTDWKHGTDMGSTFWKFFINFLSGVFSVQYSGEDNIMLNLLVGHFKVSNLKLTLQGLRRFKVVVGPAVKVAICRSILGSLDYPRESQVPPNLKKPGKNRRN